MSDARRQAVQNHGSATQRASRSARRRSDPAPPASRGAQAESHGAQPAGLAARLKSEAAAGLPGLGVSLVLHVLLLALLAIIVIHGSPPGREEPAMEVGWLSAAAARAGETPNRPLAIPVEITRPSPRRTTPEEQPDPPGRETPADPRPVVPVRLVDVESLLAGRDRDKRGRMLEKYGGSDATERAVEAGLRWLNRQQRSDGRWELDAGYPDAARAPNLYTDTGATALALLAFLGSGHTHVAGDHQETVRKGLDWLKGIQKPDGNFHEKEEYGRQATYYAHSMATIAMCEAYALSGDETLREPAESGIAFLIESQQPIDGGWKYVPQDETTVADLSVTGWALMALHTARVAGIAVDPQAFQLAAGFLDTVQEDGGARYKYQPGDPPERVTAAMTAEGLLCRQYLGWPPDHPSMRRGLDYLTLPEHEPRWEAGRRNVYQWYYVGQVLHNVGGEAWKRWYLQVQQAIVPNQVTSGSSRGSWHPTDPRGAPLEYADKVGRLYVTSLSILILEMPYRHLPLYGQ